MWTCQGQESLIRPNQDRGQYLGNVTGCGYGRYHSYPAVDGRKGVCEAEEAYSAAECARINVESSRGLNRPESYQSATQRIHQIL
jgi:hypothetical protein